MTLDELNAIKRFKNNLELCFANRKKESTSAIEQETLNYVLKVINLHYELSVVEFMQSALEQESAYFAQKKTWQKWINFVQLVMNFGGVKIGQRNGENNAEKITKQS